MTQCYDCHKDFPDNEVHNHNCCDGLGELSPLGLCDDCCAFRREDGDRLRELYNHIIMQVSRYPYVARIIEQAVRDGLANPLPPMDSPVWDLEDIEDVALDDVESQTKKPVN